MYHCVLQDVINKKFLTNHWDCKKLFCDKTWTHISNVMSVSAFLLLKCLVRINYNLY